MGVERSRFATELSVLQFREVKVHPSGPSSSRNHAPGTLMGDNRNAPSWGKRLSLNQKDQLTSNSTSSPTQNCCTAMKLHKAIPLRNPRSLIQAPITDGGFLQPILSPVLRLIFLRTASA